jgi:Skp family chaperone for outer membrane proteins
MTKKLFLLLLILGLGFVGGFLGAKLASPQGDIELLREDLDSLTDHVAAVKKAIASLEGLPDEMSSLKEAVASLEGEVARLKEERVEAAPAAPATPGTSIKIAYVDLDALLDEIFAPRTSAQEAYSSRLDDLRQAYQEEKIDKETYTEELVKLEVEGLRMQVDWSLSLLRKLKASFGEIADVLDELSRKLKPLEEDVAKLEEQAAAGVKEEDLQAFFQQYQQLQLVFQQLEQLLTQTLSSMLAKLAGEVAKEEGIALVVQRKDVLFVDPDQVIDLAEKVKARAPEFFGG